jgi:glycerol-3-phosphate acyltransferase PlsY
VLRTLGKKAGALTFGGDFLKGALAVLCGLALGGESYGAYAGTAAVLGHCFSIPKRLKGGKGVATAFGVFAIAVPWAALGAFGAFLVTLKLGKMVSLASIVGALTAPVLGILSGASDSILPQLGAIALIVVWRHRPNIQRIVEGREPRIGSAASP